MSIIIQHYFLSYVCCYGDKTNYVSLFYFFLLCYTFSNIETCDCNQLLSCNNGWHEYYLIYEDTPLIHFPLEYNITLIFSFEFWFCILMLVIFISFTCCILNDATCCILIEATYCMLNDASAHSIYCWSILIIFLNVRLALNFVL